MLNEVKHLAIAREILRCAQNDVMRFEIVSKRANQVGNRKSTI